MDQNRPRYIIKLFHIKVSTLSWLQHLHLYQHMEVAGLYPFLPTIHWINELTFELGIEVTRIPYSMFLEQLGNGTPLSIQSTFIGIEAYNLYI